MRVSNTTYIKRNQFEIVITQTKPEHDKKNKLQQKKDVRRLFYISCEWCAKTNLCVYIFFLSLISTLFVLSRRVGSWHCIYVWCRVENHTIASVLLFRRLITT